MIGMAKMWSIANLIQLTAGHVPVAHCVHKQNLGDVCSPYVLTLSSISRFSRLASGNTHKISKSGMQNAPGSRGQSLKRVHSFDLRRSRYIGLTKTRLQHILIASALNVVRIGAWLMERPRAQTRTSRFATSACTYDRTLTVSSTSRRFSQQQQLYGDPILYYHR